MSDGFKEMTDFAKSQSDILELNILSKKEEYKSIENYLKQLDEEYDKKTQEIKVKMFDIFKKTSYFNDFFENINSIDDVEVKSLILEDDEEQSCGNLLGKCLFYYLYIDRINNILGINSVDVLNQLLYAIKNRSTFKFLIKDLDTNNGTTKFCITFNIPKDNDIKGNAILEDRAYSYSIQNINLYAANQDLLQKNNNRPKSIRKTDVIDFIVSLGSLCSLKKNIGEGALVDCSWYSFDSSYDDMLFTIATCIFALISLLYNEANKKKKKF